MLSSARLINIILAAACFGAPSGVLASGIPLTASYSAELEKSVLAAAASDAEFRNLLNEALKKFDMPLFRAFLIYVRWCRLDEGQAARVNDSSQESIAFLTRELSEPADADARALQAYYRSRAAESFPKIPPGARTEWTFDPDVVAIRWTQSTREICVDAGKPAADGLEYFAHELVHFSRAAEFAGVVDPLSFADVADYARKTALAPGDEVDAYLFEYGLRARRHGRAGLGQRAFIQAHFSDLGAYAGTRDEFASFVLNDLGYLKSRFEPQYRNFVAADLNVAKQKQGLERELLVNRETQIEEYRGFIERRSRLFNRLWPAYRAETKKAQTYLAAAEASRDRLGPSVAALRKRADALAARLKPAH